MHLLPVPEEVRRLYITRLASDQANKMIQIHIWPETNGTGKWAEAFFEASQQPVPRGKVIDDQDITTWLAYSPHLGKQSCRIRNDGCDIHRDYGIETLVAESEFLSIHFDETRDCGTFTIDETSLGYLEHFAAEIDTDDLGTIPIRRQRDTGSDTYLKDAFTGNRGDGLQCLGSPTSEYPSKDRVIMGGVTPITLAYADKIHAPVLSNNLDNALFSRSAKLISISYQTGASINRSECPCP